MKKFFKYLLVLPLLWACGSDNDSLNIVQNEQKVKMNASEEHKIETLSDRDVSFSSENSFIAAVNKEGIVTASKVGTTFIKVLSDGKSQKVKITVEPKYWLYEDPILEFGITYTALSRKIQLTQSDNPDIYLYKSSSKNTSLYRYRFSSGTLRSVDLDVIASRAGEVDKFLEERYKMITESPKSYINAFEQSTATVFVQTNKTPKGEVNIVYSSPRH